MRSLLLALQGCGPVSPFCILYNLPLAACWIMSQDKLTDIVFDVNNAVPLRA